MMHGSRVSASQSPMDRSTWVDGVRGNKIIYLLVLGLLRRVSRLTMLQGLLSRVIRVLIQYESTMMVPSHLHGLTSLLKRRHLMVLSSHDGFL